LAYVKIGRARRIPTDELEKLAREFLVTRDERTGSRLGIHAS
jgi:hypothetical protein